MKKIFVLMVCLLSINHFAIANDDKPIEVSAMPQAAQQFIGKNFPQAKVSYAMVEKSMLFGNEYKVVFANGEKVEFDKNGAWTDVECKTSGVPAAVVPAAIKAFIAKNHVDMKVSKIEKDTTGYEVTLSNGMELKFDTKMNFVRYDD